MFTPGPVQPDTFLGRLRRLGAPMARETTPFDRFAAAVRRPLDRAWFVRFGKLDELDRLGESVSRTAPPAEGKRVLVLSLRMWAHHAAYESIIAQALRLRGADVALLTCGGGQPICELGWGRRVAPRPCDRCAYVTSQVARRGALRLLRLTDEFAWGQSPDKAPVELDRSSRLSPPDATRPSSAWFVKNADVKRDPDGAAIESDFAVSVVAVEGAFARILDTFSPDVVFALNGLFAAERAVRAVAGARGVRVVTYEIAPRKDALLFGQTTAAPEMLMHGLVEDELSRPLSREEDEALNALLRGRVAGTQSHERYFDEELAHEGEAVRTSLGLDPRTRVISAFTNLAWDTALLGKDIGYASQFDWLAHASRIVSEQDGVVLVIRVHPAESRWGTEQPVAAELTERLGHVPRNVHLVGPDEPVSSYGLLAISELVLCYTTTVGLEAAVRGISVAVGGETHYRGRGFTIDVETDADLVRAVADPPRMTEEQVEHARRYAFAFFFRLMIPFPHVRNENGRLAHVPVSAEELLPGRDPRLDFVCDRILDGGELLLPRALALG